MLLVLITLTSLAVLVRIVANPLSNVFQKQLTQRSAEPLFVIAATYGFLSIVCLFFWPEIAISPLSSAFWVHALIVSLLAVLGNVFLVKALRTGDLSVLGPINAYKSVVSIVFGIILLNEIPSPSGLLGVGLIVLGSYLVLGADQRGKRFSLDLFRQPEIQLRVAALICSAIEAVFIKKTMLLSSPLITFVFWCLLSFVLSLGWVLLSLREQWKEQFRLLVTEKRLYLALFLSVGLMQFSTNVAFGGTQVGYALALFQTSALLSVLFGYQFFKERNIALKLIGASIMIAGAVLITLFR